MHLAGGMYDIQLVERVPSLYHVITQIRTSVILITVMTKKMNGKQWRWCLVVGIIDLCFKVRHQSP